jgi:predicted DNA-binding protein (UPF0251 family)
MCDEEIMTMAPRPCCKRRIGCQPLAFYFKPGGIPLRDLSVQTLGLDELEAIRLADLEGLYHEQGAEKMGVSRATFGRILEGARHKIASALVQGQALQILSEKEGAGDELPSEEGVPADTTQQGEDSILVSESPEEGRNRCRCGRRRKENV